LSAQQSDLEQTVRKSFVVKDSFVLPGGEFEYQVTYDEGTKGKFVGLSHELEAKGYRAELTGAQDEPVLVLRKAEPSARPPPRLPALLALLTLVSIVVFSLLQRVVYEQLAPSIGGYQVFFGFGVAVAVMLGAHEVAQRYVAKARHGGHANSYLLPGIPFLPPFIPSLGFAASQTEPALNRDRLFDTVVAGPLAILGLAIVFYILGDVTAVQSSITFQASRLANSTVSINPSVIQMAIDSALGPVLPKVAQGYLLLSPVSDGATVGFVLAFVGLLPMASFDGGLLSTSALGSRAARAATYLSVLALLVLDTPTYWALAVVVLLIAGRPFKLKLLDDVSRLSSSRKWAYVGLLVLAFLCLPFPHNLGTYALGGFS
jgi:uncharacterized membrane protein (DUF485 family)